MGYQATELQEEVNIKKVISIHYFEYMSDFSFPGESHDFWEFLYVDKGELFITVDHDRLPLRQGQLIFHKPGEFHALAANKVIAPNLVVISFEAKNSCMAFFNKKLFTVGDRERSLLAHIISEARDTFDGPMDDPYMQQLTRKAHAPFGAEQMIKIHMEQFLIQLIRSFSGNPPHRRRDKSTAARPIFMDQDILFSDILTYLDKNISRQLTVERICRDNLIGLSQLKKLFREHRGGGVMECFNLMKVNAAKQLIRNKQMNFTQIADYLGYTSVHYFSRHFKKITNMTPSEYRSSIMRRAEMPEQFHSEL